MAFSKLIDCDKSDMSLWANSIPAKNFIREVMDMRDTSTRNLFKNGASKHDENASSVKAFEKILELIEGLK